MEKKLTTYQMAVTALMAAVMCVLGPLTVPIGAVACARLPCIGVVDSLPVAFRCIGNESAGVMSVIHLG